MIRKELAPGVVRVRLQPEEARRFEPVVFLDGDGEYLRQTGFEATPRPVYRLVDAGGGEVRKTANGEVVVSDEGDRRLLRTSHTATLRFRCRDGQVLTGLGQHEDGVFDYSRETERLYQHNMKIAIPFLLASTGWGLWIEAGCAMRFTGEGEEFTFELDAVREVSYVVIRGRDCAEVLRRLSDLTGRPALLPKWAYGYVQSKERYKSADELIETVKTFRRRGLGIDGIVLDWQSWVEGCWGDKTPDPARFPSVRALTDALHAEGVRLMVSIWPNAGKGRDCDELRAIGAFLPGSQIYDAFSPAARDLYWRQCRRCWMDGGADALWCDSCEPITDPDWCGPEKRDPDERMRLLTEAAALRMDPETMNDYASAHLRGLYEHWRGDFPGKRPVMLARSGGADSSAFGAVLWSGDTAARWDVLRRQVTEGIKIASSGVTWWTLDIGAFFVGQREPWFWRGDYPDGVDDPGYRELYVRWFQFGSMLPMFRSHGTDTPREPWRFGPEEAILGDLIALRYRLLPYLYASAAQSCRDGLPMMRAMMTAFPSEPALASVSDQYMLGDALLVRPVTAPLACGGSETTVVLPAGGWYDLLTGEYRTGGKQSVPTPLERFPVFTRAGAILPVAKGAKSAAEVPSSLREILVYGGANGAFTFYDDAGDGPVDGVCVPMRYDDGRRELTIGAGGAASREPIRIRLYEPDGTHREVSVVYDGRERTVRFD